MGNKESSQIQQQQLNAQNQRKPFAWLCTNNRFVDNNDEFDLAIDNPSDLLKQRDSNIMKPLKMKSPFQKGYDKYDKENQENGGQTSTKYSNSSSRANLQINNQSFCCNDEQYEADFQRVQQLYQIVNSGRLNLDQQPVRNSYTLNQQNYPSLSLQFRLPGHQKNTELVMNPQGPLHPQNFKNESRRTNDGTLFFGQNKFNQKGIQINDFVIEFTQNLSQVQQSITKSCPDRLRGRHAVIYYNVEENNYKIQDLGLGIGTFLSCDSQYQKNQKQEVELHDDCIIQIGASIYGLVNLISRKQYENFIKEEKETDHFLDRLNNNQQILRVKLFGSSVYGQVKYFVPEWGSTFISKQNDQSDFFRNLSLEDVEQKLPQRHFTVGRKQKLENSESNAPLHKVHDLEIPNDSTVSSNQCYFVYKPNIKKWFIMDGKYDPLNQSRKPSSNGTWIFVNQPRTIESGQIYRINGTQIIATTLW